MHPRMPALRRLNTLLRTFSTIKQAQTKYAFKSATRIIPHPEKAYKGGEDALCHTDNMLAVADGVGGWADAGVDPGIYSKKLCALLLQHYQADKAHYTDNPHLLLEKCVSLNKEVGSSTVCILTLNPDTGVILAAYMGDSVYCVLRGNPLKTVFTAPENQRSFNFPYQVGTNGDDPRTCIKHAFQSEVKDLFLVASDGLWDNISESAIETKINESMAKGDGLEGAAEKLGQEVYKLSLSRNYKSPFHLRAAQAGLYYPPKGKSDDISLILAEIIRKERQMS